MRTYFLALGMVSLLSSCGGSGNEGAVSAPLEFTSVSTASIAENTTAAYQASASNPNRGALVFSIEGGADASRFAITASGALNFVDAPDYDLPGDADGDNVYSVRLRVTDGRAEAVQLVNVTVTNSREGIKVTRIGTGLENPVDATYSRKDPLLVAGKDGRIYGVGPTGYGLARTLPDIPANGGVLGIAYYGSYPFTRRMLVAVTAADGAIEIRDYLSVAGDLGPPRPDSTIFRIPNPGPGALSASMRVSGLTLYIATGDGGDPANAQDPNSQLGKILRLQLRDPGDRAPGPTVSPVTSNPYFNGGGDPYVFAKGLRQPKLVGDATLFGDIGPAVQELNRFSGSESGLNFGWPFRDGTQNGSGTPPAGLIDPVAQYSAGTGPRQGSAVVSGVSYGDYNITSLRGLHIFADGVSGNIWTAPTASLVSGQTFPAARFARRNEDFTPDVGTIDRLVWIGFGDGDLNLYLIDGDGDVFMVTPAT